MHGDLHRELPFEPRSLHANFPKIRSKARRSEGHWEGQSGAGMRSANETSDSMGCDFFANDALIC
jgi:hypothetical protein